MPVRGGGNNRCAEGGAWTPSVYGSLYSPTLGSGGGASTDDTHANLGGSGGGALVLRASKVEINAENAILTDGSSGFGFGWGRNTGGSGGYANIKTGDLVINVVSGKSIVNSKGGGAPATKYIDSPNTAMEMSGGGGGYVYVQYQNAKHGGTVIEESVVETYLSVVGGCGAFVCSASTNYDAQDGIKKASRDVSSATIKKELIPVYRGAQLTRNQSLTDLCPALNFYGDVAEGCPNRNFNPYALQIGDFIKVKLTISNLSGDTTIKDERLKVPGTSKWCKPYMTYTDSMTRTDLVGYNDYNSPAGWENYIYLEQTFRADPYTYITNPFLSWNIADPDPEEVITYLCRVTEN